MPDLISQALNLVLYGMGSVFLFLTVLVGCTMLMSYLLGLTNTSDTLSSGTLSSGTLSSGASPSGAMPEAASGADGVSPQVVAAISAAVKRYRMGRSKQ
ncbi:MAG: OadG family protein [Pseudomonadales bacterium]|nr:OadG family protein [Pseudomonadales bacterium]